MTTIDASAGTRREGSRELPLGPKARRTRASVLAAAARLFEANGYQRTTVADIATEAGVSLGTVYQYFRDRGDIVAALVRSSVRDIRAGTDTAWRAEQGRDGLRRVLANFVTAYAATGPVAGVWEEVIHLDPVLADLRRELGRAFTAGVERSLRAGAEAGLLRDDLDPALAAVALAGMVDRFCYVTYVFDPPPAGPPDAAEAADLLTELWASAVGL